MLAPGVRIGAYVVEEQLGRGGMAAVWRARHEVLGSLHAIKCLLPEFAGNEEVRHRFVNEGRIQAQLRHPAIVPVTDLIEQGPVVGLVMDYVKGTSLDVMLRQQRTLPVAAVREIFLQVTRGLSYVHARGVVHRDLKPSNIMVDETDRRLRARLLDFGVAKLESNEAPALTRTGMTLGTLQYMSPEQVKGEAVDGRSDVFALGIVLYEVLTGRIPFDGNSAWSLQMAIVGGKVVPPGAVRGDLPPALSAVLLKALQPDPAARFQSVHALEQALEEATRPQGEQPWSAPFTPPPGPVTQPPPTRQDRGVLAVSPRDELGDEDEDLELAFRPRRARWPLALLVLVLAAGGGAYVLLQRPAPAGPDEGSMNELVRATVRREPKSGLAFVRLPPGEFRMGCDAHDPRCDSEQARPRLVRVEGFWMAKTEATVEAWDKCVAAGACAATARTVVNEEGVRCNPGDPARKSHPVNCLNWEESKALCRWLGGRLPTSAEWEYAARSGRTVPWPWGEDAPTATHARFIERGSDGRTAEVGRHRAGSTPWGLHDVAGNVWEVTADHFDAKRGTIEARGGSFNSQAKALHTAHRFEVDPAARSDSLGVRCVIDRPWR